MLDIRPFICIKRCITGQLLHTVHLVGLCSQFWTRISCSYLLRRYMRISLSSHIKENVGHDTNVSHFGSRANNKPQFLRTLFFGSDDFSLESLKALDKELKSGGFISRLDVVSSMKSKHNPVQRFAVEQNLELHAWPPDIKNGEFDIGLVVSFGNLIPQHIINSFPFGMLNVHASLLPRWRGAAPIIYSILNGDKESGVTIMRIKPHRFDIGDIVSQAQSDISPQDTRVQLTARLAKIGSQLLIETMEHIPHCLEEAKPQPEQGVTYAPRVTSHLANVIWCEMDSNYVFNLSRSLEGLYPLFTSWHGLPVKLFKATKQGTMLQDFDSQMNVLVSDKQEIEQPKCIFKPGTVEFLRSYQELRVLCRDNCWVHFQTIGLPGKKPMQPIDFYNGYMSKQSIEDRIFI